MELLVGEAENVCVVGDIDQNIYSWRGADIKNVLQFEKHFSRTKTILLEENYRSTQTIIAASNDVIKKNQKQEIKSLFGRIRYSYRLYNQSRSSGRNFENC